MLLKYSQAQLLAHQSAASSSAASSPPSRSAWASSTNVNAAIEVAHTARGILGGNGVTSMYPVMRHMANLESILTYEGTAEVHTLIIGQGLTGLSAFR